MKFDFLLPLLCGVSLLAPAQQAPSSAGDFVMEKDLAVPMREYSHELLAAGDTVRATHERCAFLSRLTGVGQTVALR